MHYMGMIVGLFFLLVSCEQTLEPDSLSSSSTLVSSSEGFASSSSVSHSSLTPDSLWNCTQADSTIEWVSSDTLLPYYTLSIMENFDAKTNEMVQFQAYMRLLKGGSRYKVCLTSSYGNISRTIRADSLLEVGVRKISVEGGLDVFIRKNNDLLFEKEGILDLSPLIYNGSAVQTVGNSMAQPGRL